MRPAFTMIEMLVALAIAAVLMIAVLDVTTTSGVTLAAVDSAQRADEAWIDRFNEQLTRDLVQADRLTLEPDRIVIEGHGGLDAGTLARNHTDCRVTYRVIETPDHRWLVREQVEPGRRSNLHRWTELMGEGVGRLRLERISDNPARRSESNDTDGITPTVRWAIDWADEDRPPTSRLIRLR